MNQSQVHNPWPEGFPFHGSHRSSLSWLPSSSETDQEMVSKFTPLAGRGKLNANKENTKSRRDLQDGGGVRHGDHLPPHKYIRNTSTCGTTLTEHLLNAGRRRQTSQKARNSPHTWIGQKKKEKTEAKE